MKYSAQAEKFGSTLINMVGIVPEAEYMRKVKVFIELEVEIDKMNPNDKALNYAEIADFAAGGIALSIKECVNKNSRPSKVTSARYEFTISEKC